MELEKKIISTIEKGLAESFGIGVNGTQISLQPTKKEFAGTFTFVTFPFTKTAGKPPHEIAEAIGKYLESNLEDIRGYNVVKGFLNLEVADSSWCSRIKEIAADSSYGISDSTGKKVMVEYSSPNTNKPLHLGHLRNNFLGWSVSEILAAAGNEVIKANLINDRGIHICKSMVAYLHFGNGETPESAGMKGDHLVGKYYVEFDKTYKEQIKEQVESGTDEKQAEKDAEIFKEAQQMLQKWESGDAETVELWKKMNGWVYEGFEDTYSTIGVGFDKYYYESDTYLLGKKLVEEGLGSGVFYKKADDSVWCDLTADKLDEKLLLRSDGTSVYMTQDMGTADLKFKDYKADQSVYVVGNEQDYHFKVLQLILQKLGRDYAEGIYHLSYGMVDLPSGKMKSREGTVVDADDLVAEMVAIAKERTEELGKIDGFTEEEANQLYQSIALGALKYYLLKVDPKKRMLFNPEESIDFQGDTGVFIQYSHARMSSILRKAIESGIDYQDFGNVKINPEELEVIEALNEFPKKVTEAAQLYAPSVIAQYTYDLAKSYSKFFAEVPIFKAASEDEVKFRVSLTHATRNVIAKGLELLGIEAPNRM